MSQRQKQCLLLVAVLFLVGGIALRVSSFSDEEQRVFFNHRLALHIQLQKNLTHSPDYIKHSMKKLSFETLFFPENDFIENVLQKNNWKSETSMSLFITIDKERVQDLKEKPEALFTNWVLDGLNFRKNGEFVAIPDFQLDQEIHIYEAKYQGPYEIITCHLIYAPSTGSAMLRIEKEEEYIKKH